MTSNLTLVKCPTCQKQVSWTPEAQFKPFCSERCKMIDLGDWATESFKIPCEHLNEDTEPLDITDQRYF